MSSKYIHEDDFYDDENEPYDEDEEFIEEDLSPEEQAQLDSLLPTIKQHFANYNNKDITDELLKKTLWLNYFEITDSINEVKANYKKIPKVVLISMVPKTLQVAGSSKLALLLQKRLLKRKQQELEQQNDDDENKLISILDKLSPSDHRTVPITRLKQPIVKKNFATKELESLPASEPTIIEQDIQLQQETSILKPIDINTSLIEQFQTSFSKLITLQTKKRKLNNVEILSPIYTNDSIIVKKITSNFAKPSPDDIILKAQANLFNDIEQNLQKISIAKQQQPTKTLKKNNKIDLKLELSKLKPQLSFVIFGHVDSGKSTIIGRMLYDLKIVDSKTLHKLQQESDKIGKSSFALAWIMDQTDEERSRGVTVDIVNTCVETDKAKFNIIDSPGHLDFVPQLINGIAQADVGVLIIDCKDFTNGFNNIKEQVLIAKNLGIDDLIIALNKFDLLNYDTSQLDHVIENLKENLHKIGYDEGHLQFVPVSGLIGDNVVTKSTNFQWSNSLIDSFNDLVIKKNNNDDLSIKDEPFIMTINEIIDSNTKELRCNGRVNNGFATLGDELETLPTPSRLKLDSSQKSLIIKGDFINDLKLKFINSTTTTLESLSNGDLITNDLKNFQSTTSLQVDLQLFELSKPLLIGASFILFHNCKQYPSKITKINSIFKTVTGDEVPYKKRHLVSLTHAKVVIELEIPLSFNLKIDKLTRIVLRKDNLIIGCGKIYIHE